MDAMAALDTMRVYLLTAVFLLPLVSSLAAASIWAHVCIRFFHVLTTLKNMFMFMDVQLFSTFPSSLLPTWVFFVFYMCTLTGVFVTGAGGDVCRISTSAYVTGPG